MGRKEREKAGKRGVSGHAEPVMIEQNVMSVSEETQNADAQAHEESARRHQPTN